MAKFYNTRDLTLEQMRTMLREAHAVAIRWWVDILDCGKSFLRQRVDMPFEEILVKLDGRCHFVVIHRDLWPENHLEIAFSTLHGGTEPDYYLWIHLDPQQIPRFTAGLECR